MRNAIVDLRSNVVYMEVYRREHPKIDFLTPWRPVSFMLTLFTVLCLWWAIE